MPQPIGCWLLALSLLGAVPVCTASRTTRDAEFQTLAPTVDSIRQKLRVVAASKGLSPELTNEAKHVLDEADQAMQQPAAKAAPTLDTVLKDYKTFVSHLLHRSDELTKKDKQLNAGAEKEPEQMTPEEREAKAATLVPVLREKVQKLLLHIEQEKGLNQTQGAARDVVEKTLQNALSDSNNTSVDGIHRAVGLHEAMVDARDYVMERSKDLDREEAKLGQEITEGTERILLSMLMQRRKLPMPSQLAILKRKQFANCTVAKQLLKKHDKRPLFDQLMAILPESLVGKFNKAHMQQKSGHLAAAGSNGNVQVVSSRLKNEVQKMIAQLRAARTKLVTMAKTKVGQEAAQAKHIAAGLDEMLTKVEGTKDLKSQLEMMDQVEGALGGWASEAQAAANSTQTKANATKAKKSMLRSK